MIGAATGMLAWSVATCTGDSADSLWIGAVALITNIIAWAFLGRRVPSKLVLIVAVLPALAALSYTASTIQLAVGYFGEGLSACDVLKDGADFGYDGREPAFIVLWLLVCLSFWGGLAPVLARAVRVHGGPSNDE